MAASAIFSTFISPQTASFSANSSPSLRFLLPTKVRMLRTVTQATASKPTTGPRPPRGIMKPRLVSPEMQAVVGVPEIPRTQALKLIWAHIKEHNLQVHSCFSFFPFFSFTFITICCYCERRSCFSW